MWQTKVWLGETLGSLSEPGAPTRKFSECRRWNAARGWKAVLISTGRCCSKKLQSRLHFSCFLFYWKLFFSYMRNFLNRRVPTRSSSLSLGVQTGVALCMLNFGPHWGPNTSKLLGALGIQTKHPFNLESLTLSQGATLQSTMKKRCCKQSTEAKNTNPFGSLWTWFKFEWCFLNFNEIIMVLQEVAEVVGRGAAYPSPVSPKGYILIIVVQCPNQETDIGTMYMYSLMPFHHPCKFL